MINKNRIMDAVREMMEDKVNEIFAEMQGDLGIHSGDIDPMTAYEMEKMQEALTEKIANALILQKEMETM